jgi:uncharacterized membrane protein
VAAAFNWGWNKFRENAGVVVGAVLVYLIVLIGVDLLWQLGILPSITDDSTGFTTALIYGGIGAMLNFIVQTVAQAGIVRGASEISHGRKPQLSTMFTWDNLGQVIIAALLVAIIVGVGIALCFVPGLIAIFYLQFTVFFVVERGLPAVDAIRASASLVNQHVGSLIGFFLASIVAFVVGAILCLVGLLIAFPVVVLAQAYTYRTLQGDVVAP